MSSTVMLFVQGFHLLAAMVVVGGVIFLRALLIPATRRLEAPAGDVLLQRVHRRFRILLWVAMPVLFASGVFNMLDKAFKGIQALSYIGTLGVKIMLALLVFSILLLLTLPVRSFAHFQAQRDRWLVLSIILAVLVVGLAGYLRLM